MSGEIHAQVDSTGHYDYIAKPGIATIEGLSFNILLNRYDAHILGGGQEWARVSPSSWGANIKGGLEWDIDAFGTNFFGHPYHGSTYYNSARSLGLSFWQSVPYAVIHSTMWEFFGETERPSANDLISTTFGGVQLGEITHRLSDNTIMNQDYNLSIELLNKARAACISRRSIMSICKRMKGNETKAVSTE